MSLEIDWRAYCRSADPKEQRDVAYRFGNRVFYDPGYTLSPYGIGFWQIAAGPSITNQSDTFVVAPGDSGVGYEYIGDGTSSAWDVLLIGRSSNQSIPGWLKNDHLDWAQGTHA